MGYHRSKGKSHISYITFGAGRSDSTTQTSYVSCGYKAIIDLSKYNGIKAAYFEAVGKTSAAADPWSAQLYDLTNSAYISGSEIALKDNESIDVFRSGNILAALPLSEVKMEVRVKVVSGGTFSYYGFRLVLEIE